jgi:hypothetical protein
MPRKGDTDARPGKEFKASAHRFFSKTMAPA